MDQANLSAGQDEKAAFFAYDIAPDGRATCVAGPLEDLRAEAPEGAAYRWVHLHLNAPATVPWLTARLEELTANSLTADETRPRLLKQGGGALLNLRGINLNPQADPEDMVSIRLWITPRLIVSVWLRRLLSVQRLQDLVEAHEAPLTPHGFIAVLGDYLTDAMEDAVHGLSDQLDALETTLLDGDAISSVMTAALRRKSIILRRYIAPQRDAFRQISLSETTTDETDLRFNSISDRTTRLVEELDAVRDRAGVLSDEVASQQAGVANDQLKVLSIVSAIFLPLGFFTGLFGVNVAGMPGTQWAPAFAVLTIGLTLSAVALFAWFKLKRWL